MKPARIAALALIGALVTGCGYYKPEDGRVFSTNLTKRAPAHTTPFVYHYQSERQATRHGLPSPQRLSWPATSGESGEPTLRPACRDGLCTDDPRWKHSTF